MTIGESVVQILSLKVVSPGKNRCVDNYSKLPLMVSFLLRNNLNGTICKDNVESAPISKISKDDLCDAELFTEGKKIGVMKTGVFLGPKVCSQRFLRDAIDIAQGIDGDVNVVITGLPEGGDGSDMELLDDDNLQEDETRYANRDKNMPDFQITNDEMYRFIGLLLLSGYNMRTSAKDYWSKLYDLSCPAFAKTMSRNRFQKIEIAIHAADNQSLDSSKMAKIKPLYELLNQSLLMFGILHEDLSIDESMVPYYGRHFYKQFIRGKPIGFGYKCWVIASSCGLPYKVTVYEGKTEMCKGPFGTRTVMDCLKVCQVPASQHIYFDSFFTSYDLIAELKTLGYRATGTVRQNRIKGCPLKTDTDMKKTERGSYDYRSDGDVEIVRWNDNSVVTLCSNVAGVEPVRHVKRRVKNKGSILVPQPHVVACYNKGMGGADLLDRALANYRPSILGKKWYWTLLVNAINIAVVFSWRVYQLATDKESKQKDFRRNLVTIMLKQSQPRPSAASRPGPSFLFLEQLELTTETITQKAVQFGDVLYARRIAEFNV
ncbi:piggyBac transposable element-derived protein 3-like [Palaemon carinicauda]|uniref:piggyBac transposable element-derived protein 3-like n=1 Tax=Palaemon carinicauda TaxID=392227 RepID=UPI0035B6913C